MEQSDIDRFFSKVNKTDTCWLWTGCIHPKGKYGHFGYKRKVWRAHRVSWVLSGRILIEGYEICHSCRNRHCVNPAHLRQDTKKANQQDRIADGTDNRGTRSSTAKLTEEEVLAIRASNKTKAELSRDYNVTHQNISSIINRVTWKHI